MQIRPGTIADVPAIARVYVASWKTTYEGLVPELFLKGITYESAVKIFDESFRSQGHNYSLHVVESPEGQVIGFADFGRERSHPESGQSELYGIYLLKGFQRQGIGGRLFEVALQSMAQMGLKPIVVWVLDKSPYRGFYEKAQGKLQPGYKQLGPKGQSIQLVSYVW